MSIKKPHLWIQWYLIKSSSSMIIIVNFKENCSGKKRTVAEKQTVNFGGKVTLAEKGRVHIVQKSMIIKTYI